MIISCIFNFQLYLNIHIVFIIIVHLKKIYNSTFLYIENLALRIFYIYKKVINMYIFRLNLFTLQLLVNFSLMKPQWYTIK